MNISVCVATRGDIDIDPILESLPEQWEKVVWDNGREQCVVDNQVWIPVFDCGPHGRFAAIRYASHPIVYVQDDDVIVTDPEAIVAEWQEIRDRWGREDVVVCNMPAEFLPHYPDSAMVGFGAVFHRDAPETAFARFFDHHHTMSRTDPLFLRESCRVFTTLTPHCFVDIPKTDMPYASNPTRLWKQPGHIQYRERALKMAREVRDQN